MGTVIVSPTGVTATSAVGTVSIQEGVTVYPTGVAATGGIGYPNVWGLIIPSQTPNWSGITPSQTPAWTDIAA